MRLRPGEVVLIGIGFHQSLGGKLRPAVVVLDTGDDDFVGAPITSSRRLSEFDLPIRAWQDVGLNTQSTIRVQKLTVLTKVEVVRRLGHFGESDFAAFAELVRSAFSLGR